MRGCQAGGHRVFWSAAGPLDRCGRVRSELRFQFTDRPQNYPGPRSTATTNPAHRRNPFPAGLGPGRLDRAGIQKPRLSHPNAQVDEPRSLMAGRGLRTFLFRQHQRADRSGAESQGIHVKRRPVTMSPTSSPSVSRTRWLCSCERDHQDSVGSRRQALEEACVEPRRAPSHVRARPRPGQRPTAEPSTQAEEQVFRSDDPLRYRERGGTTVLALARSVIRR